VILLSSAVPFHGYIEDPAMKNFFSRKVLVIMAIMFVVWFIAFAFQAKSNPHESCPYDKCPKCGNPFIYGVVAFGSDTGRKFVGCNCGWQWHWWDRNWKWPWK